MHYFDKIWSQLFPQSRPSHLPILEEALLRSDTDKQNYWRWLNAGSYHKLLSDVREGYEQKKRNLPGSRLEVHILKSDQSNGIAITYPNHVQAAHFEHLFDLLRDRTQNLGYQHYTSGRRVFDRAKYIETIDKHYLKPPKQGLKEPPFDQQYGNILIELIWIDRRPSFMRLMAHVYSDHLFGKARTFDELLEHLLR